MVAAHFDAFRVLRAHVRQTLENYAAHADRVVVVSTSGIDASSMERLPEQVEFVERRNFGYDFFSYKWGLDIVGDYADYDQILIANDSFVGPTIPLAEITGSPQAHTHDLMGMTLSHNHGDHVQSFFMLANGFVARSKAFRSFWKDMVPVSDRMDVIQRYEFGFSRAITDAGFRLGSYFQPTAQEEQLAAARFQWHAEHRLDRKYPDRTIAEMRQIDLESRPWNPGLAYADRVLLDDRLPLLKFDALRFDPYSLGADHLLAMSVEQKPEHFGSIPNFLSETRSRYPTRPGEQNRPTTRESLRQSGLGYGFDAEFANPAEEN
ncbi:rhamnan synthesis F family protein [Agrococcus sediminis]|uniref:rhamnan synthesis F family protein n=1 Tax=Agrococcus sediminis TaxID=2599924 RepID=UPI001788B822|nr:rhamnan synthesis F family protein [Agrococcus sediminis]